MHSLSNDPKFHSSEILLGAGNLTNVESSTANKGDFFIGCWVIGLLMIINGVVITVGFIVAAGGLSLGLNRGHFLNSLLSLEFLAIGIYW